MEPIAAGFVDNNRPRFLFQVDRAVLCRGDAWLFLNGVSEGTRNSAPLNYMTRPIRWGMAKSYAIGVNEFGGPSDKLRRWTRHGPSATSARR